MFFAWLCYKLAPKFAPKELLDTHTVRIKLLSICLMFSGLALLAVSQ